MADEKKPKPLPIEPLDPGAEAIYGAKQPSSGSAPSIPQEYIEPHQILPEAPMKGPSSPVTYPKFGPAIVKGGKNVGRQLGDLFHGAARTWPAEPDAPLGRMSSKKALSGEGYHAEPWGGYASQSSTAADWYRMIYGTWPDDEHVRAMAHLRGLGLTNAQIGEISADPVEEAKFYGFTPQGQRGALYQLRYPGARPDEFLEWEKTIDWQSRKIKTALRNMGFDPETRQGMWNLDEPLKHLTGQELYNYIGDHFPHPEPPASDRVGRVMYRNAKQKWVSEHLLKAGIKGASYPGDEGDTRYGAYRNFVIFHPESLKVIGRWGILPFLYGAAGLLDPNAAKAAPAKKREPPSGPVAQPKDYDRNFKAAVKDLKLTPQEQYLYQFHLRNLWGKGKVINPDRSISTLYNVVVKGPDGRYYNIPTVWDGQKLKPSEARRRAANLGWDKWPSYATPDEADKRYVTGKPNLHDYMDRDEQMFEKAAGW